MTEKHTLTLPASLERLEIDPGSRSSDGASTHVDKSSNPFQEVRDGWEMDCLNPEAVLESLSLSGAECSSGTCHCNRRRLQGPVSVLQRTNFKRPILQRSRLGCSQLHSQKILLKEPILRLSKTIGEEDSSQLVEPGPSAVNGQTAEELAMRVGYAISEQKKKASCLVLKGNQKKNKREVRFSCSADKGESIEEYPETDMLNRQSTANRQQAQATSTSPCSLQARLTDGYVDAASSTSQTSHIPTDDTTIDELASYFDLFVHIPKKMSHMAEMMYI